ncbi:MAG: SDR family oxidoreductase [Thioploca sp.]|nr:SDR family oxidoreductase [Thioploca sp.]
MRILLVGASGFIGKHLLIALLRAGHTIRCCTRQSNQFTTRLPNVTWIYGDLVHDHRAEDWFPRLQNMEAVINVAGIIRETSSVRFDAVHRAGPCALFTACVQAGVQRVIQISALGADTQATTPFHRSKKSADDFLAQLPLEWFIVYPSLVYGRGGHSFALFLALAALPLVPLPGKGNQQFQPIAVDDLTNSMVSLLTTSIVQQRLAAVGPTPISLKDFLAQLRSWLGKPPLRSWLIPLPFMLKIARLGSWLHHPFLNLDTLSMLLRGNIADPQPLARITGIQPKSLERALAEIPVTIAEHWQTKLYFLKPLLRLSIALVWLLTGIVSAFVYPIEHSYQLLATLGISGWSASVALFGAASLDFGLGLATLLNYRLKQVGSLQLFLILLYTLLISWYLPEFWWHPYGPVSKNLPLVVATLIMISLADENSL